MKLIQILLPLYNNEGELFPELFFETLKKELTEKFGGLTAYTRSPANGLWKDGDKKIVKDDIIIFEIMARSVEPSFWRSYKLRLKLLFQQDEIIVRVSDTELI